MSSNSPLLLIVEDELPIRRFLHAALSGENYRLVEAETGERRSSSRRNSLPTW